MEPNSKPIFLESKRFSSLVTTLNIPPRCYTNEIILKFHEKLILWSALCVMKNSSTTRESTKGRSDKEGNFTKSVSTQRRFTSYDFMQLYPLYVCSYDCEVHLRNDNK